MDIIARTQQLCEIISYARKVKLEDSRLEIIPCRFNQIFHENEIAGIQAQLPSDELCNKTDDSILENKNFDYLIFTPTDKKKRKDIIILLHGLNERSWKKYLTWAEYLANTTGKSVILFPIAFHMNRTPGFWNNPRSVLPWVEKRKAEIGDLHNSTFVNVALSSRLSQHPFRFYTSGRETIYNIWQLISEIRKGNHPLFSDDASVNLFGYSIGGFLSQVLMLANPDNLFSKSRLFIFCGGSIFSQIDGNARDIMDSDANERLQQYYRNDFLKEQPGNKIVNDSLTKAFKSMIRPDFLQEYRESFFKKSQNRIRIISLKKDTVTTTKGAVLAIGSASEKILNEMDFPYAYTHQWPFPLTTKTNREELNLSFDKTFGKIAAFL